MASPSVEDNVAAFVSTPTPHPDPSSAQPTPVRCAQERDGCAIVDGLELSETQVDAIREGLEPWASRQIERPDFASGEFWEGASDGWGRAGASNVLFEMAQDGDTVQHTLSFMLHPELLAFATAAFGSPEFVVDDASIAAYPRVGEANNLGAAARGGSDLHGWHRGEPPSPFQPPAHTRAAVTTVRRGQTRSTTTASSATSTCIRTVRTPSPMRTPTRPAAATRALMPRTARPLRLTSWPTSRTLSCGLCPAPIKITRRSTAASARTCWTTFQASSSATREGTRPASTLS